MMPAFPIAHPARGSSWLGVARCSWFDQRTPASSTVARVLRSSSCCTHRRMWSGAVAARVLVAQATGDLREC